MAEQLRVEYISVDKITPYAGNAKLHPEEQIEQIKRSIQEFGFNDPIALWHSEIVEGHGRLMAAKELGMKEVPVIRLDELTDEQRRAYALVHNKLTMNSGFDFGTLEEELASLDIDMSKFGFTENGQFEDAEPDELDAEDPEESDRTVVRLVFNSYKEYHAHEQNIKAFANSIGCAYTIGK